MLPELDWEDEERTLVRDESNARVAPETSPMPRSPAPPQKTVPIEEHGPVTEPTAWKKSTVRMSEPGPTERFVTLVGHSDQPSSPATQPQPVWDDDTVVTDVDEVVRQAPESDRRALERVLGPMTAKMRDSEPQTQQIPDAAPTQPQAAASNEDLDQEDYDTIAFERDPETGELRPVDTGVRLKRAGQAIDMRQTVVGMAPPSHLLAAIEEAERRAAERRAREQTKKEPAKEPSKPRPKALSVDDSIDVLPVLAVTPRNGSPSARPQPEPAVDETGAMTAWPGASALPRTLASEPPPAPHASQPPPPVPAHPVVQPHQTVQPAYAHHPPPGHYPAPVQIHPSANPVQTFPSSPPPAHPSTPPPHAGPSTPPHAGPSTPPHAGPSTPPHAGASTPPHAGASTPPHAHSSAPPGHAPGSAPPPQFQPNAPARDWATTMSKGLPADLDAIQLAEQIKRRSRLRSIVAALVSVLFVFAAVVVGALAMQGGKGGTVRIHVQSSSGEDLPLADIYLDGDKVCEATPCVLRNVQPGARKLRVEARGHAPHEQPLAVDKGQDRMLAVTVERHGG